MKSKAAVAWDESVKKAMDWYSGGYKDILDGSYHVLNHAHGYTLYLELKSIRGKK